jgi:hypothetical protein
MKRDKKFIIDSIKMDLFRVITAAGDMSREAPLESIRIFMEHANKDFDRIELDTKEEIIRKELNTLANNLEVLSDPHTRLRWTEDVMTARCRL